MNESWVLKAAAKKTSHRTALQCGYVSEFECPHLPWGKALVATDGHRLHMTPTARLQGYIEPAHAGKHTFPDWQEVMPWELLQVPPTTIFSPEDRWMSRAKSPWLLYFTKDSALLAKEAPEVYQVAVNPACFGQAIPPNEKRDITVRITDRLSPVVLMPKSDDPNWLALIMPICRYQEQQTAQA